MGFGEVQDSSNQRETLKWETFHPNKFHFDRLQLCGCLGLHFGKKVQSDSSGMLSYRMKP